jgi:hypothetical protein
MGAASVSICRPWAVTLARSAFRATFLIHERRTDLALAFNDVETDVGAPSKATPSRTVFDSRG